ncbi:hypothetical protein [Haloferula sp. A504]|uniref:hypothetical protein n=1 Tax=Haloferula sp. A504 TaxID=3373601 RepID=UPI0031BEA32F|nr:hypothetical protein [Verrucomicrobiaceae bacterium E54]
MTKMTVPQTRRIIEDFVDELKKRRQPTAKPSKSVINFRTDRSDGVERQVWRVPIDLLRFRKDNGRVASDVLDYEQSISRLDEAEDETQEVLRGFLSDKDPEKTDVLRKSIKHAGQQTPAIVTCDGFLIDGNRRKMVLDMLHREYPEDDSFAFMKVVILPGEDDEGGAPTLLEIEKLENRYQLQSDGKSEYYGFDRALSIKRKMQFGLSLEEQLRDDPRYAEAGSAEMKKAIRECEKEYLKPLECVDRYLRQFRRSGCYRWVSAGMGDKEGRWQAFKDYSNTHTRCFGNPKKMLELSIEEDEVGEIEEAAFNIIRLRTLPDLDKVHVIMRSLPKYCRTKEGKKEIKRIAAEVEPSLPKEECVDENGTPLSTEVLDAKWVEKYRQPIIHHTKKAASAHENQKDKETPIELLEAAYKKLTHDDMDMKSIGLSDLTKARKIISQIHTCADDLESEIYKCQKNLKSLQRKGR